MPLEPFTPPPSGGGGRRPKSVTPIVAGWIIVLAALSFVGAWMALSANQRARQSLKEMEIQVVGTLGPGIEIMRMADGVAAAMPRLIGAESHSARLAAAGTIARHESGIRELLGATPGTEHGAPPETGTPAAPHAEDTDPEGDAPVLAALIPLADTVAEANRLASRRIDASRALPAARERLVALLANLNARIAERQEGLTALSRFHPATTGELRALMEWGLHSKRLLGALLLTVNGADGQSGVASAAQAHLDAMDRTIASLPDSGFATEARELQTEIATTVTGPDGVLAQLATLRDCVRRAESLSVEAGRETVVLSAAVADRLERGRHAHDHMVATMSETIEVGDFRVLAVMVATSLAALLAALHTHLRIGARLRSTAAAAARALIGAPRVFDASGHDQIGAINDALDRLSRSADEKRETAAIAASRFELAVGAARAAVWDVDLVRGRVWWSPGYLRMLGFPGDGPSEGPEPDMGTWESLIHPDDRAMATNAVENHLAGISGSYHAVYRMRRADDRWIRVEDHGQAHRDADGRVVRFVGMTREKAPAT